jgi:signal transduction histidine kinase
MTLEPWLTTRSLNLLHLYNILQLVIILALLLIPSAPEDYYAILLLPLVIPTTWNFPLKIAIIWIVFMMAMGSGGLFYRYGFSKGIGYVPTYWAGSFFITAFGVITLQAERTQKKSQELLAELQGAHQKLQAYSAQVQQLAAAEERNRLARELHDSVTQTIFSLTLTAQAAEILLERDPSRVAGQLRRLQELAQNALSEMRSLIQHLRPKTVAEEGLIPALKRHFDERQTSDNLAVELQMDGEAQFPPETDEAVYRVIQEALNNVVKHAKTNQAIVRLNFLADPVSIQIEDHGIGFNPDKVVSTPDHIGLSSMVERVRSLGGSLTIESKPGEGTCIRVDGLKIQEDQV